MTDLKNLARIAKACRKAGILKFECPEFKFELNPEEPVKITRTKGNTGITKTDLNPDKLDIEELSDQDLLLWSAVPNIATEGSAN